MDVKSESENSSLVIANSPIPTTIGKCNASSSNTVATPAYLLLNVGGLEQTADQTNDELAFNIPTIVEAITPTDKPNRVQLNDSRIALVGNPPSFIVLSSRDYNELTQAEQQVNDHETQESGTLVHVDVEDKNINKCPKSKKPRMNRDADNINQSWFTSRSDKDYMSGKGENWRRGLWQKEEQERLEKNIKEYCLNMNITDPGEIIFNMSKDERKDFYRSISHGLQRPLFSVYRRVIRHYDPKNYLGRYSADDRKALKRLHEEYGNDWVTIGANMGRSASSVKDKCCLIHEKNGGKWLAKEETCLVEAVQMQEQNCDNSQSAHGKKNINWSEVAQYVNTRTAKQCRTKWLNYLSWKVKGGSDWTRDDDIVLLKRISLLNFTYEVDIDWEALAANWSSARSPQWLRGKWWTMKRHVPNYQHLSLSELLAHMTKHYLENLKFVSDPPSEPITLDNIASYPALQTLDVANNEEVEAQISDQSTVYSVSESETSLASEQSPAFFSTTDTAAAYLVTQPDNIVVRVVNGSISEDGQVIGTPLTAVDNMHQIVSLNLDLISPSSLHNADQKAEEILTQEFVMVSDEASGPVDTEVTLDIDRPTQKMYHSQPHSALMTVSDPMMVSERSLDLNEDKR